MNMRVHFKTEEYLDLKNIVNNNQEMKFVFYLVVSLVHYCSYLPCPFSLSFFVKLLIFHRL